MERARLTRPVRIAILLLLGVVIGFPRHKIYEQTLSLIAVAAIAFVFDAPQKTKRWFLLGLLIGVAAFFGRNSGVFCAIATAVAFAVLPYAARVPVPSALWRRLVGGTAMGYSPMIVMLVAVHGFAKPFFSRSTNDTEMGLVAAYPISLACSSPGTQCGRSLTGADGRVAARGRTFNIRGFNLARASFPGRKLDNAEWLSVAASAAGAGFLLHAFYTADFFHIAKELCPSLSPPEHYRFIGGEAEYGGGPRYYLAEWHSWCLPAGCRWSRWCNVCGLAGIRPENSFTFESTAKVSWCPPCPPQLCKRQRRHFTTAAVAMADFLLPLIIPGCMHS